MKRKQKNKPADSHPRPFDWPFDWSMKPVLPCALCGWRKEAHLFPREYPATLGHRFKSPCA